MAFWRRKALAIFPELATELNEPKYAIYQLFFDLTPMAEQGHRNRDTDLLGKIYGFAEWCLNQSDKDLWNSAGAAFYEHLFDERSMWDQLVPWLSPEVISQVQGLRAIHLFGQCGGKDKTVRFVVLELPVSRRRAVELISQSCGHSSNNTFVENNFPIPVSLFSHHRFQWEKKI